MGLVIMRNENKSKKIYIAPSVIDYGSLQQITLTRGPNGVKDCGGGLQPNCGGAGGNDGTSL